MQAPVKSPWKHAAKNENTSHEAIGYVDDLSQVMENKNLMLLQQYIQEAYEIMVQFFNMNLLSIKTGKLSS